MPQEKCGKLKWLFEPGSGRGNRGDGHTLASLRGFMEEVTPKTSLLNWLLYKLLYVLASELGTVLCRGFVFNMFFVDDVIEYYGGE